MEKELLATGIFSYKNILGDPQQLIDTIESAVNNKEIDWELASVKSNGEVKVNEDSRNTWSIGIPYDGQTNNKFRNEMANIFYNNFVPIEKDYMTTFNINLKSHEPWGILKYGVGQKFNNHVDDLEDLKRRVSFVYYANDNYEGGEINFPRFGLKYKPKANEAICFPSSYVYNHSVSPVVSGLRYAVVGWIC
jgi:hypothetical protein